MLADYDEITTRLADSGVNLVFTGHTHMQNIAVKRTEKGNVFYDVNRLVACRLSHGDKKGYNRRRKD